MRQTSISSNFQSLETAKKVLKSKFFGIDEVIDQIICSIQSWYVLPELQSRPLVINLWGMTGVGKTELIQTLIEILGLKDQFLSFDCGELESRGPSSIKNILSAISESQSSLPQILLFDEFQLARTISQEREELSSPESRILWQILDNGIVSFHQEWYYRDRRIQELLTELTFWINQGLTIVNGTVSEKDSAFLKSKYRYQWKESSPSEWKKYITIPKNRLVFNEDDLFALIESSRYKYGDQFLLETKIRNMNGEQILEFLKEMNEIVQSPNILDLSKSLIFIVGNLDEVYEDSKEFSADLSPDIFFQNSKKITLSDVKKALLKRFRAEQISRLGNNHILYPSLNSQAYQKIIQTQLEEITNWVKDKSGLEINFKDSVSRWVFQEGVIPTQGVRPVKSTIRYGVEDQIPRILLDAKSFDQPATQISICYQKGSFIATFLRELREIDEKNYPVVEKINSFKVSRNDDSQAITAVHESGHAIVLMDQLGVLPNQILSVTSESGVEGLVNFDSKGILSLEFVKRRLSVLLAGFEAERLIFGKDHVTNGSSDDILRATELIMKLLKGAGFGQSVIQFALCKEDFNYSFHTINEVEKEAKDLLEEAGKIASSILKRDQTLLLEMASILANQTELLPEDTQFLMNTFGSTDLINAINTKNKGYREILLDAIHKQRAEKSKTNQEIQ